MQVTFNFGETSSSLFNSLGNFHHGNRPMVGRRILHANDSEVMYFFGEHRESLLNTILPIPEMDIKASKQSPRAIDQPFPSLAITCPYALAWKDMIL